jgi:hypothetical protein
MMKTNMNEDDISATTRFNCAKQTTKNKQDKFRFYRLLFNVPTKTMNGMREYIFVVVSIFHAC